MEKTRELERNKNLLEEKLGVKITLKGKNIEFSGKAFDEYQASIVLDALNVGFSAKKALLLLEEDNILIRMPIKNFTRRKNLSEVRARIIGSKGKTKKTIEEISGCFLSITDNEVGIIGSAEDAEQAKNGLAKLIGGTKESNVYHYLEGINTIKKKRRYDNIIKK